MPPSNDYSTVLLLIVLIAVLNGKAILLYLEWLRFKLRILFKKLENDYNNNSTD
jgi:hypothetical protein